MRTNLHFLRQIASICIVALQRLIQRPVHESFVFFRFATFIDFPPPVSSHDGTQGVGPETALVNPRKALLLVPLLFILALTLKAIFQFFLNFLGLILLSIFIHNTGTFDRF